MNKKILNRLAWLPVLFIMGLIFYFSSRTGSQSNAQSDPIVFKFLDLFEISTKYLRVMIIIVRKSGHIIEYIMLGFFMLLAFYQNFTWTLKIKIFASVFFSYLYALSDEWHQLFVAQRSGLFSDTLVDLVGIIIGVFLFVIILKINKRLNN